MCTRLSAPFHQHRDGTETGLLTYWKEEERENEGRGMGAEFAM